MSDMLKKFDDWFEDTGPAALVIREYLLPVEGRDGVIFPATFASGDGFPGGYNIDSFPDGTNVCLIDSVGSQANRIEPMFRKSTYAGLVPQIVVKAGTKQVNLLEAGHRAADAIVRCSALQSELQTAFKAVLKGNAEPLAKIAPTSLIFGVWDSRDTQAKSPRLVSSSVRALNVRRLSRSAQYIPAVDYVTETLLEEPSDKKTKDMYSARGFVHVPSTNTHGGVIATGDIRRDAILHIAAMRLLTAGPDKSKTDKLRRYLLGLALTAFTFSLAGYLRQGCNLVLDPEKSRECVKVYPDGRREDAAIQHSEALEYAKVAAEDFGINPDRQIVSGNSPDREVEFDKELAKYDVSGVDAGDSSRKGRSRLTK